MEVGDGELDRVHQWWILTLLVEHSDRRRCLRGELEIMRMLIEDSRREVVELVPDVQWQTPNTTNALEKKTNAMKRVGSNAPSFAPTPLSTQT